MARRIPSRHLNFSSSKGLGYLGVGQYSHVPQMTKSNSPHLVGHIIFCVVSAMVIPCKADGFHTKALMVQWHSLGGPLCRSRKVKRLDSPAQEVSRSPSSAPSHPFFGWEGSPTTIRQKRKIGYQLVLTSQIWGLSPHFTPSFLGAKGLILLFYLLKNIF